MSSEAETGTIPKERYLSPAVAAAERERLWPRVGLHAAALDLVREPGTFVTVRLGGVADVLVIRGGDGELRAFHNVCQHRGRQLVEAPRGRLQQLRCPLHHWQWTLEGDLAHVPERDAFGALAEGPIRLPELRCATWAGHVFVHLGEPAESLAEWLAPLADALGPYGLEDYALVDQKTFELPCNWKTVADLFNEAYHVAAVHPYLLGMVDPSSLAAVTHGPHCEHTFTIGRPSAQADPVEVTEALEGLLRDNGADPAALDGDARRAPEVLRAALRAQGIERLSDDELTMGRSWMLFPSQTLNVYPTNAMLHRHRPHPTDPERTSFDQLTFRRVAPGDERPIPKVSRYEVDEIEGSGKVTEDDLAQVLAVQRGMHSPGFEHLRLGRFEVAILHMHAMVQRYLERD